MEQGLTPPRVLIAGLGNLLMGDDGVGIHAARALMADPPPGVLVIEIGTAVLHAVDEIERAPAIVALDAIDAGEPPGTVMRLTLPAAGRAGRLPSLHDLTLADLLRTLPGAGDRPVVILGIQPALIEPGLTLSAPVREALPRLVAAARQAALLLSGEPAGGSARGAAPA